ncbi:MAG: hypothetical protein ABFQ65_00755 [Nanoarchaeota archaeon]
MNNKCEYYERCRRENKELKNNLISEEISKRLKNPISYECLFNQEYIAECPVVEEIKK